MKKRKDDKKNFKYYWNFIDVPVIVLIVWTAITLVFPLKDYIPGLAFSVISWAITILVFAYIGYVVIREKSNTTKNAAKAGAWAGAITGLGGAILTIAAYYISPGIFNETLQQMLKGGLDTNSAQLFLKIGIFSGLVTGPLISALIGALIAWISSLIFRNKKR